MTSPPHTAGPHDQHDHIQHDDRHDTHSEKENDMGTESWVIAAPQQIEVADVASLVVGLTNGAIEVVSDPGRESGATVDVTEVSPRPLRVTTHAGELKIAYDFDGVEGVVDRVRGLKDKDTATVRVVLPAHLPVKIATARAAATVSGTRAPVSVTTADGAVTVTDTVGPLSVKTVAGRVAVTSHDGDVKVGTASGRVEAEGGLGRVTISTVTGDVVVEARETTPLVTAKTVSGDVTLRLSEGAGVNLKARAVTGKVVLDGAPVPSSQSRTTSVDHSEGTSGAYVSVSTVSGNLTVSRG
ncbi:DUF4097 family beta strand repeat protein [Oerskovia sp. Sa1BUA8]|uniref:DUF4097 family beta strand repeat protein n=1 Tax=Oerskovia douganii TaxID=2762210 RepID=A0A9D5YZA0_9CELL|nr:DUF4097 family beta strand repeat-containing protein [Oerskovia douganii]MBE7700732.1 DUF4097 family beta strand repeat protein [Oerskovia douganii]